jgi:hypothetical protein
MVPPRIVRYASALLVLGAGAFHLSLYLDGYRSIPRIGPLFEVDVAVAVLLAVAVVAVPFGAAAVGAAAFHLGALVAFVLSRTSGLLGFTESRFDTTAGGAVATEVLGLVVLGLWFLLTRPRPDARAVLGRRVAVVALSGR